MGLRRWFYGLSHFSRLTFRHRELDQELDDEIAYHVEAKTEENIAKGMTPEEARRAARIELGGVEQVKERVRALRAGAWLDTLFQDLRFGLRLLRKSPGFTAVAVLTLGLGIGANTATFTLMNGLMLRTLPVRAPVRLVELLHRGPDEPAFNGFSLDAYRLMRDRNHVLSSLIVDSGDFFVARGQGLGPQKVLGGYVDGTFFETLGVRPALGRLIGPEDDNIGRPSAIAVVSWSFWKSRFDLNPAILGRELILDNCPVTVVGVTERGFYGLSEEMSQSIWLPVPTAPVIRHTTLGWGSLGLGLVGRLKPGVSIERAQADLAVLFQATIHVPGTSPFVRKMKFELAPAGNGLSSPLRQMFATPLLVLMIMVGLLLLIACANVSGLLLARGASRQQEMAIRVCLGAGRGRLLRQALTESLLLSLVGGVVGIFLARFGTGGLLRIITSGREIIGLPVHLDAFTRADSHVLLFIGAIVLLATLLFGAAPAVRALSTLPASALQQAARIGESRSRRALARVLVVSQVALSMVLVSAAALFGVYLSHLRNLNLGFRRDHLLLILLDRSDSGYDAAQFSQRSHELLQKIEAIPGVRSATLSEMTPISGVGASGIATVEGQPENDRGVSINGVAPDFFKTYRTPLVAGRDFTTEDQGGPPVAIINEAVARDCFGNQNPIGRHVTLSHVTLTKGENTYGVIGVVGNAEYNDIEQVPLPRTVYLDAFQHNSMPSQLSIRTSIDPEAVAGAVRDSVASVMKTVSIGRITTMTGQIDGAIVPQRMLATLSGWFGGMALLLSALGLYGLLAYSVARRTHEIGVRMALGGSRSDVMRTVLGEALWMVCTGLAIGAPLAFWGERLATSVIPNLSAQSALPVIAGGLAMTLVALLACYIPARRAMRVDPMVALRYE
ncbi:MAG: ABC transporter permease [Candidatus Acidiferrales bacterium]